MKRALVVLGLSVLTAGCAVDQDDPITQAPPLDPMADVKGPDTQTLSGQVNEKPTWEPKQRDKVEQQHFDLGNWQVVNIPQKGK